MKNRQPIIRFSIIVFFLFGIFQTTFSQSIDSMSKVILDKVEKHYSSYETMRYKAKLTVEKYEISMDFEFATSKTKFKVIDDNEIAVSDGEYTISKRKETNEVTKKAYDETISLLWFAKLNDFCTKNCKVVYLEDYQMGEITTHVLRLESLNDELEIGLVELYISNEDYRVLQFVSVTEDMATMWFYNFEANPTFPDDYFEIKN